MSIFRKLLGYGVDITIDNNKKKAFIPSQKKMKIYINFSKSETREKFSYREFLRCAYGLVYQNVTDADAFEKAVTRSAEARIEAFVISAKLILLLSSSSICLLMQGTIFTVVSLLCLGPCIYMLAKLRKIDLALSL